MDRPMIRVRAVLDENGCQTGFWHCVGLERGGTETLIVSANSGDDAYRQAVCLLASGEATWA